MTSSFDESLPRRLTDLLKRVSDRLDADQIALIEEFIDVGEFGVALDWLVGYLAEKGAHPSEEALEEIDELAGMMRMSSQFQEERSKLSPPG